MSVAIPKQIQLTDNIPNAVASTTSVVNFIPDNGSSFTPTNNYCRIPIRASGGSWLNPMSSYLTFDITNNTDQPANFDASANACINRVRLLSGSTVISDLQFYNVLSNILINAQGSYSYGRYLSTMAGFDVSFAETIHSGTGGNALASTATGTYSVPLIIPLFSNINSKFLPLDFLSAPLTIELYFEPNIYNVFKFGTAPTTNINYTIANVKYVANIVTVMDSNVNQMMLDLLKSNQLKLHCQDWYCYQNSLGSLAASTSSFVATIPERAQVLKAIISVIVQPATSAISGIQTYTYQNSTYQYRIGSSLYPSTPYGTTSTNVIAPAFLELMKCLNGSVMSLDSKTLVNYTSFTNTGNHTGALDGNRGNYAMSICLEKFHSTSVESGVNTSALSLPITLSATINPTTAVTGTLLSFCHRDQQLVLLADGTFAVSI